MQDCIFCKICNKKLEKMPEIIYEDEETIAFKDINPKAKVHILLIPKKHISSINTVTNDDQQILGKLLLVARNIARQVQIDENGYKLITNIGEHGGQLIPHLHIHILGGEPIKMLV